MIHEATGTVDLFEVDLSLPASGFSWTVGRTYNARQQTSGAAARDSNGYQGKNWFQVSQPEIVHYDGASDSKDVVYLVYGADRFVEFKRLDKTGTASTTFRATNGAAGVVVFTSGGASVPDTYTYTDQNGYQHTFFGFDGDAGSAAGQYWKTVDPDGQVAFVGDATTPATAISSGYSSGRIQYAYDTADRRYTYTYSTLDSVVRLTQVKAETKTGGTWASPTGVTEVAKVEYSYYTSESYGDPGDLKLVTRTLPLTDSGQSSVMKTYYRYYEGTYDASTNPGYPHHLKLVLGPEGTRNYDYTGAGDSTFDDDFLTETTDNLKPYGQSYFTYDTSHRIKSCWMNGSCGCSGGLNGDYTFTYATNGTDDTGYDEDEWRYRTVVSRPDGGYVTLYFDEVAQPLARVLTDADPAASPTNTWATVLDRDSAGVVTHVHTPANITAYTHSTGAFTKSASTGLVNTFVRETAPYLKGYLLDRKWSVGTSGSAYLDGSYTYETAELTVGSSRVARPFVASVREYPDAITSGTTGSNLTSISTTVHSGTLMPKVVTVTLPDVATGNHGAGATSTTTKKYFNLRGENTFSRSMDGIITVQAYTNGQVTTSTQDADTTSLSPPTGFESSGSPFDLTTTHTYDAQGRRTNSALPSGENKSAYYTQLKDRRIVELTYNDVQSGTYYGPVRYTVSNFNRLPEVTATIGLPSNSSTTTQTSHIDETTADPLTAVNGSWSVGFMRTTLFDNSGVRRNADRTYFDTPSSGAGTDGTHYDETLYGYDDSGRVRRVKEPHGTITRTVRNLPGNTTETWVGTNDSNFAGGESSGTDNMVKTMASVYDGGSGGGNQYVTSMTAYVEGSSTGERVTTYTSDARGRRVLEVRPETPHVFSKFDNLGRVVAQGLFSSTAGIVVGTDDPTTETGSRLGLRQSFYDERGRVWKTQRHKVDDTDGSDDDNLQELRWHDAAGRVCKVDGQQLEKFFHDRLGRETHRFTLASDDDSTTYANVLTVTGDTVLVEHQRTYDATTGDLLMEARIDRHHDDTGTGALDSNGDTDPLAYTSANVLGRIQITGHWYDSFGRVQDTVAYGNYGGSTFDRDGLSVPARSATALRTTTTYNNLGLVERVEDPRGLDRYTGYDDAGRVTKIVANADGSTPPGAPSGSDTNQTVLYGYTDGLQTTMTADMPSGTSDQVTTYTFGTVKGASAGDSKLATGHLLWKVQYPDSSGGTDVVSHAYNAQGELIWRKDQGGNIIENTLDDVGRPEARTVTTVGSGFDSAVRRFGTTYTSLGQPALVTQYSDTSGTTVVDQVALSWDDWGTLGKLEADHNSAVSGGGDEYEVSFEWAKNTTGRNAVRRTKMVLPSTKEVLSYYDTGIPNNASRVSRVAVKTVSTTLDVATYAYNGLASLVGIDYPEPSNDIFMRYYGSGYPSLDRFNRVVSEQWTKDLSTDLDFYDVDYDYDENSNVLTRIDRIHVDTSSKQRFAVEYTYDNLDRLTLAEEGNWTGSAIADRTRQQLWTLDHTGNWSNEKLDLDGSGTYGGTGEYDDTRTHNAANEITTLHGNTPGYDANGNLVDDDANYQYVYDAFNRLRKVTNHAGTLVMSEYRYNGLGHLIAVHPDSDGDGEAESNSDDPWYHHVYDDRWRLVETYRDTDALPKEVFVFHESGLGEARHWNDGIVRRERDASTAWTSQADGVDEYLYYCQNWRGDVVALLDDDGSVVEWDKYSSYGVSYGVPGGDADGDDDCDASDATQIQAWIDTSNDNVLGDLNLDGDVNATDKSLAQGVYSNKSLARGKLSTVGNRVGYAGYQGDMGLAHLRHVRNRVLDVQAGEWLQRDPLEYIDGANLYSYCAGGPTTGADPTGLHNWGLWGDLYWGGGPLVAGGAAEGGRRRGRTGVVSPTPEPVPDPPPTTHTNDECSCQDESWVGSHDIDIAFSGNPYLSGQASARLSYTAKPCSQGGQPSFSLTGLVITNDPDSAHWFDAEDFIEGTFASVTTISSLGALTFRPVVTWELDLVSGGMVSMPFDCVAPCKRWRQTLTVNVFTRTVGRLRFWGWSTDFGGQRRRYAFDWSTVYLWGPCCCP